MKCDGCQENEFLAVLSETEFLIDYDETDYRIKSPDGLCLTIKDVSEKNSMLDEMMKLRMIEEQTCDER